MSDDPQPPAEDPTAAVDLDPPPGEVPQSHPIARPLHRLDSPDQETIWDRSRTPRGEPYEPPASTAIEPHPVDVDVPPIDEPGCLSHYIEYRCGSCLERCLNPEDSLPATLTECQKCAQTPDLLAAELEESL